MSGPLRVIAWDDLDRAGRARLLERGRAAIFDPQLREQIMQSKTEGFPPGYESLLQSYYQRLAQEKVGDEAAAKTPGK